MTLENIICLSQIGQKKVWIDLSTETHGDCRYCKTDEKNKYCSGYYPIKLYSFTVVNKDVIKND